ncbi:hypothetical protein ABGB18_12110 [Nonomuraea sp. B12E4]|uniref:hypothetical protein n=1 Tax=Nonomuraea sp. B12E4 TaxID=3153564 RepID=UPI00325E41C6
MPSTTMDAIDDQASLFTITPTVADAVASGVRFVAADPVASDAVLAGDGYGWLADALPAPRPPACPHCHHPAVLPTSAPVLWTCPHCHPTETR